MVIVLNIFSCLYIFFIFVISFVFESFVVKTGTTTHICPYGKIPIVWIIYLFSAKTMKKKKFVRIKLGTKLVKYEEEEEGDEKNNTKFVNISNE